MISSLDRIKKSLHRAGFSFTTARGAVFQAIEMNGPLSMHRLCAQLKHTVDRASVYRTVSLYEKLGIVRRVQLGWKYQLELTEEYSPHHHHLECLGCGRVVDFKESKSLIAALNLLAKEHGMSMTSHDISLQGQCVQCENAPK